VCVCVCVCVWVWEMSSLRVNFGLPSKWWRKLLWCCTSFDKCNSHICVHSTIQHKDNIEAIHLTRSDKKKTNGLKETERKYAELLGFWTHLNVIKYWMSVLDLSLILSVRILSNESSILRGMQQIIPRLLALRRINVQDLCYSFRLLVMIKW
jgi:hypothetical protein